jgi:hypothetical protein
VSKAIDEIVNSTIEEFARSTMTREVLEQKKRSSLARLGGGRLTTTLRRLV